MVLLIEIVVGLVVIVVVAAMIAAGRADDSYAELKVDLLTKKLEEQKKLLEKTEAKESFWAGFSARLMTKNRVMRKVLEEFLEAYDCNFDVIMSAVVDDARAALSDKTDWDEPKKLRRLFVAVDAILANAKGCEKYWDQIDIRKDLVDDLRDAVETFGEGENPKAAAEKVRADRDDITPQPWRRFA